MGETPKEHSETKSAEAVNAVAKAAEAVESSRKAMLAEAVYEVAEHPPISSLETIRIASEAAEKVIAKAEMVASELAIATAKAATLSEAKMVNSLSEALREVFEEKGGQKRFIDVTRIPLICQNIDGIHTTLKSIDTKIDEKLVTKERFAPVEKIVYAIVGVVGLGVLGALIKLVLVP